MTSHSGNDQLCWRKELSYEFFIIFESSGTILWRMISLTVSLVSGITNPSHNKSFMTQGNMFFLNKLFPMRCSSKA